MSWAEERRQDKLTNAQIAREQAAAAAQVRIAEHAAAAQQCRQDREEQFARRRADRQERRDRRDGAWAAVRAWARAHAVDVLIYPAVLIAFAMSAPSMAGFGRDVYGSDLGGLLPGISELLMLAFAVAVLLSRRRHPERPVWGLQAGVWVFAAVSAGSNFLHGLSRGWSAGAVMAIVAVSGIVAHQLALATPPRSRADRAQARIDRQAARKIIRVRRAAVRHAVAEIDTDGAARLIYAPGRYVLAGRIGKRAGLVSAIVPGLPIEPETADWDRELADLLTAQTTAPGRGSIEPGDPECDALGGGSVATLDQGADQQKSTPRRSRIGGRAGRSIEQLRAELHRALKARPGKVDPTSAESIRKALRCSPKNARQLRDDYTRTHPEGGTQ